MSSLEYEEELQEIDGGGWCAWLLEHRENELSDGGIKESEEVEKSDLRIF